MSHVGVVFHDTPSANTTAALLHQDTQKFWYLSQVWNRIEPHCNDWTVGELIEELTEFSYTPERFQLYARALELQNTAVMGRKRIKRKPPNITSLADYKLLQAETETQNVGLDIQQSIAAMEVA